MPTRLPRCFPYAPAHFDRALRVDFRGVFAEVVFAVLDTSPERRAIGPFARRFGAA